MKHFDKYTIVCHPTYEQAVKRAVASLNGEYDIEVKAHPYMEEGFVVMMNRDMLKPINPDDADLFNKLLKESQKYAPKPKPYVPPKVFYPHFYTEAEANSNKKWKGRVLDGFREEKRRKRRGIGI